MFITSTAHLSVTLFAVVTIIAFKADGAQCWVFITSTAHIYATLFAVVALVAFNAGGAQ